MKRGVLYAILLIGVVAAVRGLWPRTVVLPPRIVTVRDTVQAIDTIWLRRTITVTHPDTVWLERLSVTPPETITVSHVPPLIGATGLVVGPKGGDSTVAQGFRLAPLDSAYRLTRWQAQWYTPGPLRALTFDSLGTPLASFGDPPPKGCGPFCTLGHYLTGAAIGASVTGLVCMVR